MAAIARGTAAMPLMATVDSADAGPMKDLLFRAWLDMCTQIEEELTREQRDQIKGSAIVRVTVETLEAETDAERPLGHEGVVFGIPHPGPGPIGCPYCMATLQAPLGDRDG